MAYRLELSFPNEEKDLYDWIKSQKPNYSAFMRGLARKARDGDILEEVKAMLRNLGSIKENSFNQKDKSFVDDILNM